MEQELKPLTIVLPTWIAIIYSLYCAMWTLVTSQKSSVCQRLFYRQFSVTLTLCLVSFRENQSNHNTIVFQEDLLSPCPSAKHVATRHWNTGTLQNCGELTGCLSTTSLILPWITHCKMSTTLLKCRQHKQFQVIKCDISGLFYTRFT